MQNLKQHFSYRKFADSTHNILYLDDDYFLQKESIDALQKLGHRVTVLKVLQNDPSKMLESILKTALMTKPDCVMSINHAGFDPEGKIVNILNELRIPLLMWYLDDFRFILVDTHLHATPNTAVFTYEKQHLQPLRDTGFLHVFHLPSATAVDPTRDYHYEEFANLADATVFIGSTFNKSKAARLRPEYPRMAKKLSKKIDFTELQHDLLLQAERLQRSHFPTSAKFFHYASYLICEATEQYRRHFLEHVHADYFHVFGDKDWEKANISGKIHPPVHNLTAAPHIQRMAKINLCLSSQQLGSAVSLRAYEIPASGGFLLTDWKDDLADLFAEDEIVSFRSVDEMNDKIDFYQRHPEKREPVIRKARERVINEHQVFHRIQKMLAIAAKIEW